MTRRVLGHLAKILVSVVLLVLVFRRVDLSQALAALARVRAGTLAAALALALLGYVGRALRWSWLLRQAGVTVAAAESYRLTLVGTFYGLVTPGRVGEFARVLHLGLPRSRTLPSVVWDRVGDVLLLELMSIPAFVVLGAWRGPLLAAWLGLVAATVIVALVLDHAAALGALARAFPALAPRLERWRAGATGVLRSAAFARGLVAGLFFYALNFAGAWLLLRDLAPGRPAGLLLAFPVIILLGNLPVAFGGLGLREQVAALMFVRFGAAGATGPVFSLLWFAVITLVPGLLGLLLLALPGGSRGRVAGGTVAGTGGAGGRQHG